MEWIHIDEQVPETKDWYLIARVGHSTPDLGYWAGSWFDTAETIMVRVTYWMPLPVMPEHMPTN